MKLNMWEKGVIMYTMEKPVVMECLCGGEERLKGISKKDRENVFVEHEVNKHNSEFRYSETKGFKMTI